MDVSSSLNRSDSNMKFTPEIREASTWNIIMVIFGMLGVGATATANHQQCFFCFSKEFLERVRHVFIYRSYIRRNCLCQSVQMISKAEKHIKSRKRRRKLVIGLMNTMILLRGCRPVSWTLSHDEPIFHGSWEFLGWRFQWKAYFSNLLSVCFFHLPAMLESPECRRGMQAATFF